MSAINYKFFGSDIALDVKTDFCSLYGIGKSTDEINEYILSYKPSDNDEDACAFWSALACIEWQYGILNENIKNKAMYIIENKRDDHLFINEKDRLSRKKELKKLREMLKTQNPTPKKIKKTFVYRTSWKLGDILALKIYNKYVYLHVCAVKRESHKIKELESDCVFVKVFDMTTETLLDMDDFKPELFQKLSYKNLDNRCDCTAKLLWCVGVREKNALEKKTIHIGNIPIKYQITYNVYADFQFKEVENTLAELFKLKI